MVSIQFSKNAEMVLGAASQSPPVRRVRLLPQSGSHCYICRMGMSVMGVQEICDEKSRWIEGPAWRRNTVLSAIAFHEKAGPSQVSFLVLSLDMVFSPAESPLSPPFHPHSLRSDFVRSVQVGCSRYSRCCHLIFDLSSISRWKRARRLTQSPELGFGLLLFLSKNVFDFMLQPALLSAGCGAAVHTLLR
jgi:hypothetical protein